MLVIGSKVNGYTIEAIENRTVLAFNHSTTCPERYVVWDLDCDGDGVNTSILKMKPKHGTKSWFLKEWR